VSNINYAPQETVANFAVAPLNSQGKFCIYSSSKKDVILDVAGFITPTHTPGSSRFFPVNPHRLVDTRSGQNAKINLKGKIGAGGTLVIPMRGVGGIPSNAKAVAASFVVVDQAGYGYVTVWPCNQPKPLSSLINYAPGTGPTPNAAFIPLGTGNVCVYSVQPIHLVVDMAGYFV
jgi:hypothetical protein